MTKLLLTLTISIVISIYSIIKIKNSNINGSTKNLLYFLSVLMPVIGFIVVLTLNRSHNSNR